MAEAKQTLRGVQESQQDRGAQRRYFKHEAKRILLTNWGGMCFTGAAPFIWMAGVNMLRLSLCGMLGITGTPGGAPVCLMFDLISLSGAAPLFMGFVKYAADRAVNVNTEIGEIFYYLRSLSELLSVYRFLYALLWRVLLELVPAAALSAAFMIIYSQPSPTLFGYYFSSQQYRALALGCVAAAVPVALIIAFIRSMRYLPSVYMFARSGIGGQRELMKDAAHLMRGRHSDAAAFCLGFAGWAVLSVVSFGIIFILFALPYFICSYVCYCSFACIGTVYCGAEENESAADIAVKQNANFL